MQESAGIIILNKNNKVLILRPSGYGNKIWSVPKGKIEKDEMPIDAAIRETEEEAGIKTDKDKLISLGIQTYKNKKKKVHLFLIKVEELDDDYIPNLNWENDKFLWIDLEQSMKLIHEAQIPFMEKIKELIK